MRIFQIQKTLFHKHPIDKYNELINNMSEEQIKNKIINTTRTDKFNMIPVKLKRMKPIIFRKKYKLWLNSNPTM